MHHVQPRSSSAHQLHSTSMTLDEITSALKSSDATPMAALRAGVAKTDELAPLIFAIADKLCSGVYLLPEENDLLFDRVVMIAQRSEEELNQLFPDHIPTSVGRLLLSVWNNDSDALFELIEHSEMIPDTKWALFDVLARLTFDGRIPRERTIAFLERLEREEAISKRAIPFGGAGKTPSPGLASRNLSRRFTASG